MDNILLLTSAGLAVSGFIALVLTGILADKAGRFGCKMYLSLSFLQAALLFFKILVDRYGGPKKLSTFLIYVNFLYGLPCLYLFLRSVFKDRVSKPVLHFLPCFLNVIPALLIARTGIGTDGLDGPVAKGFLTIPQLYLNALALGETAQVLIYSGLSFAFLRRTEGRKSEAYRRVVELATLGYLGYYITRWIGVGVRFAISPPGSLLPAPRWIAPLSVCLIVFFVSVAGLYILAHPGIFFRGRVKEPSSVAPAVDDSAAKYGGRSFSQAEAVQIIRQVEAFLATCSDLTEESIDPHRIARRLGIPYYLISRAVNEYGGMTMGMLIKNARVERAKSLIARDPDMSIMDIAMDSGFSAKSSFNAAFKESVGVTPSEYRRRIRFAAHP